MLASAQVVDAIAARMRGGPLVAGRVYTSRAWPLAEKELPAWRVVAVDEDVEPDTIHRPPPNRHRLQVELRGYERAVQDLDDRLHALAEDALGALFSEQPLADALAGLVGRGHVALSLRRIERGMAEEGEAALGLIQITVRAEFHVRSDAPATIL